MVVIIPKDGTVGHLRDWRPESLPARSSSGRWRGALHAFIYAAVAGVAMVLAYTSATIGAVAFVGADDLDEDSSPCPSAAKAAPTAIALRRRVSSVQAAGSDMTVSRSA